MTGGYFGFYTGGGSPAYYDYVTKTSLDGGSSSSDSLVVDDFEDGDLSEYSFENGNDGLAAVVSSPTYNGGYALDLTGAHYHLNSTSGLQNYPRAGDTISGWIRGSADITGSLVLLYGVQDFENRYYAYVDIDSGTIRIRKKVSGSITTLAEQTGVNLSTGTWYEVEIDWEVGGTHTLTVYDTSGGQLGQVSISNETRWTSGGIGYNAHTSNGASGYFDLVTVSETRNIGSFDTSFDGWMASGSNSLSRVDETQQPAAVTEGDHALEVTVNSDPEPVIQNETRIRHADLQNHPCLLADVLPSTVENSSSAVTFRFRYHHSSGVEESHEMTVDQQYGGRICWDMSGLSTTKLTNPERLDIVWYPQDHPPGSGFDYNGVTYVDNVQLTDDQDDVTTTQCVRKHRDLERAHGLKTNRVIESQSDTLQEGVYQYSDGTEIPYEIEKFDNGDIEERVDGDAFRWTGGSA